MTEMDYGKLRCTTQNGAVYLIDLGACTIENLMPRAKSKTIIFYDFIGSLPFNVLNRPRSVTDLFGIAKDEKEKGIGFEVGRRIFAKGENDLLITGPLKSVEVAQS